MLSDCRGVGEGDGGWLGQERQGYTVRDVSGDLVERGLVRALHGAHEGDLVQPVPLLGGTGDEGNEGGRKRGEG